MFAPPIAKQKAKIIASSKPASARRATLFGHFQNNGHTEYLGLLHQTVGNQAMLRLFQRQGLLGRNDVDPSTSPQIANLPPPATQTKLIAGHDNDRLEHQADRVADEVSAVSAHPAVNPTPPEIQHMSGDRAKQSVAPASEGHTLAGTGRSLEPTLRWDMEQRFDYDFSRVKVHTGPEAAQSAQSIDARAYTLGQNIVFGAGQYSPDTEAGKHLLAHELAHVVQQPAGGHRLFRKEVSASVAGANRASVAPGDWLDLDRQEWEMASQSGSESSLSPTNTFMRAVYYNTKNLRPQEYTTIRERHDYYDIISYVLEHDPNTPGPLQGVRFFHATTAVTGTPGIGSVETPIGYAKLQQQTRQIFTQINEQLFALNMGVINNLLFNWQEPRNPKNPAAGAISSFDFDIKMVETEQSAVEDYIRINQKLFTSSVTKDINETLDPNATGQFFNFSRTSFEWAIKALHVQALDFTDISHRQAIGFANVHIFHRKSYSDYENFMRSRMLGDYPITNRNAG